MKRLFSKQTGPKKSHRSRQKLNQSSGDGPAGNATLASPAKPDPPLSLSKSAITERANPQAQSPFFGQLPPEIRRLIYVALWRTAGLSQHIFQQHGQLVRRRCLVEDDTADDLLPDLDAVWNAARPLPDENLYSPEWFRHLFSSKQWFNHWKCRESIYLQDEEATVAAPFQSMLLCCRLMYLEAVQSASESLSFVFTDVLASRQFLATELPLAISPRNISLSLCYDDSWKSSQLQAKPIPSQPGKFTWERQRKPSESWKDLLNVLAVPDIRHSVHIWLDVNPRDFPHGILNELDWLFSSLDTQAASRLQVCVPGDVGEENDVVTEDLRSWPFMVQSRKVSPYFIYTENDYIHRIDHLYPPQVRYTHLVPTAANSRPGMGRRVMDSGTRRVRDTLEFLAVMTLDGRT